MVVSVYTTVAVAGGAPAQINVRLSTKGNDIAFDQTAIQVAFGKKVQMRFPNEAAKGS